ncbi:probable protein phosphatase 2C 41 [Rutidosis leptorrhynchoides]|uniref:probable protein phosphatase 2C 41 n=1 Tax=Rutidosis leptorrhynchoides TaxID=125765 RepID=UPI003A98EFE5
MTIWAGQVGQSWIKWIKTISGRTIEKTLSILDRSKPLISKAYERTDQAILSHLPDLGRGGLTVVTAVLINGHKLWVANIGDSRAVLFKRKKAIQMNIDHEPNTERSSIENRGGFTVRWTIEVLLWCSVMVELSIGLDEATAISELWGFSMGFRV